MTAPVSDSRAMIAEMAPVLRPGRFVFCTTTRADPTGDQAAALALFREDEGLSLILPEAAARAAGFPCDAPMALIALTVFSSLEGVGLTAAASGALAQAGVACNVVAAFHHDYLFVPFDQAARAMAALTALRDACRG